LTRIGGEQKVCLGSFERRQRLDQRHSSIKYIVSKVIRGKKDPQRAKVESEDGGRRRREGRGRGRGKKVDKNGSNRPIVVEN